MNTNYLHYIGYIGPIIMIYLTILYFYIFDIPKIEYFIKWLVITGIINTVLKHLIKSKRPNNEKPFVLFNRIKLDNYGMPSGHAQYAAFILLFFAHYATDYKLPILFLYSFISILTLYQRYYFRAHSGLQVIAGVLIGIIEGLTERIL